MTSESDSIEFSITDLLGRPVPGLKPDDVVAQSGTRLADDVVVLSKQPLAQKPNEPTTFVLNLSKIKAQYGLYKIALRYVLSFNLGHCNNIPGSYDNKFSLNILLSVIKHSVRLIFATISEKKSSDDGISHGKIDITMTSRTT